MLSPAQNMASLDDGQFALLPPILSGSGPSVAVAIWYQRDHDTNLFKCMFIERATGTPNGGTVARVEVGANNVAVPFAAYMRATNSGGGLTEVNSTVPVPSNGLGLIVAWRTSTQLGVSVNGEPAVTAAFSAPSPAIEGTYALLGGRDDGSGPFALEETRHSKGSYYSIGSYAGNDPDQPPLSNADIAAIYAAGPVAFSGLPTPTNGSLIEFHKIDSPVVPGAVDPAQTLRFLRGPSWVASPTPGTSGQAAWDGTRVYSFGEGPNAFVFPPDASPIFREPVRRVELTSTTKGQRALLAMAGKPAWDFGFQFSHEALPPGSSAPDDFLLTERAADGSSIGLLMVGGRLPSIRVRDAGGTTLHQVTADEPPFGERLIDAVSYHEVTTTHGNDQVTRLDMTVEPGHDIAEGDYVRITDPGWPDEYTVTFVSDDDTVISVVRAGFGLVLPAEGARVYGTGREPGAGTGAGSFDSTSIVMPRYTGLRFERDGENVGIYARGRLIGSGTIPISVLGSTAGAVSWLGGAPGEGPAHVMSLAGLIEGTALSPSQKSTLDNKLSLVVEGRDGWRDDAAWVQSSSLAYCDRVCVVDHPAQWHVRNPDGTDHDTRSPSGTGQSVSRSSGHFACRSIGEAELSVATTHPTRIAVWAKTVERNGTLKLDRHTIPPAVVDIPVHRRPVAPLWRKIYCSNTHPNRSDAVDNDGTDPNRPLASIHVAFDRAGPFDDVVLASGDTFPGTTTIRGNGARAAGRVRLTSGSGGPPAVLERLQIGGTIRNVVHGVHLRIPSGDGLQLTMGGGINYAGMIKDMEVFADAALNMIGSSNLYSDYFLFDYVRPRNANDNNVTNYGWFPGGANHTSMVACDSHMRSWQNLGGHPARLPGTVYFEWAHVPPPEPGFLPGGNNTNSIRNNARHVYLYDWAAIVPRSFVFLTAPPWVDSRSNFLLARIGEITTSLWTANGVRIESVMARNADAVGNDSGGQSNHVSARLRVLGAKRVNSTNAPWPGNTQSRYIATTGPYRWQGANDGDHGAQVCPDIGSVFVDGGDALIQCDGLPLGGTGYQTLGYRYRPVGGSEWTVRDGIGSANAIIPLSTGNWELQPISGSGAANGAIVEVTVE